MKKRNSRFCSSPFLMLAVVTTVIFMTATIMPAMAGEVAPGSLKVCYADDFGGNSWRRLSLEIFKQELTYYPEINQEAFVYTDANGNVDKAISNIRALTAQKCDIIWSTSDFGPPLLPAIRQATTRGVKVGICGSVDGVDGKDYVARFNDDMHRKGWEGAQWLVEKCGAKNIVMIGGIPGNTVTRDIKKGSDDYFAQLGTGQKIIDFADGYWDVNKAQQAAAQLIAKNPKIDGVLVDWGPAAAATIRAFQAAKRPIPAFATEEYNLLVKMWGDLRATEPGFKLSFVTARNFNAALCLERLLLEFGVEPRETRYKKDLMKKPSSYLYHIAFYDADESGFEKLYRPQYGPDYPVIAMDFLGDFPLPEEKKHEIFPK